MVGRPVTQLANLESFINKCLIGTFDSIPVTVFSYWIHTFSNFCGFGWAQFHYYQSLLVSRICRIRSITSLCKDRRPLSLHYELLRRLIRILGQ